MWDKLDIEIPFKYEHVKQLSPTREGQLVGFVDISDYEFQGIALVSFDDNGFPTYEKVSSLKWDSIASSISKVAVGFFPEGNGFNTWPHVRVKASPAKILQGHNVYGSENIEEGMIQMLANFTESFPRMSQHLDMEQAHVRYVDCTYSAKVESSYFRNRIFDLLAATAKSNQKINTHHKGYLQLGVGSEYNRQKVYEKENELLNDLSMAKRRNEKERVSILSNPELQLFSQGLLRFEATIGHRQFERLGIPTRLQEFIKFHHWYQKIYNESLCQYLWT
jgi:II/X family phage/plasmid replication protein